MFKITPEQIDTILDAHKQLQTSIDAAIDVGCLDINGKLFEHMWTLYGKTSQIIDPNGWIDWYIYDNDYGKKSYECTIDSKTIIVTNTTQLAEIINH